jgi:hexosaminidase
MQVWGVSEFILNADDATISFMQDVLREVLTLFPGPYIHIGGDEAVKTQWKASPQIQARIKQLGLKDEHELQSWFIRQMDVFLTKQGRRLVGWDEILEGGLAEKRHGDVVARHGGGIAAAKAKHDVVMTPGSHTYFDHYQSRDRASEPLAIGGSRRSTRCTDSNRCRPSSRRTKPSTYSARRRSSGRSTSRTPRQLEYMAFPRLVALSRRCGPRNRARISRISCAGWARTFSDWTRWT